MNRKQCPRFAVRLLGLFMVILALGASASAEWKEKVLYTFQGGATDCRRDFACDASARGNCFTKCDNVLVFAANQQNSFWADIIGAAIALHSLHPDPESNGGPSGNQKCSKSSQ
jgi:hypothetical protein